MGMLAHEDYPKGLRVEEVFSFFKQHVHGVTLGVPASIVGPTQMSKSTFLNEIQTRTTRPKNHWEFEVGSSD